MTGTYSTFLCENSKTMLVEDHLYSVDLHAVHLKMDKLLNSEDDR